MNKKYSSLISLALVLLFTLNVFPQTSFDFNVTVEEWKAKNYADITATFATLTLSEKGKKPGTYLNNPGTQMFQRIAARQELMENGDFELGFDVAWKHQARDVGVANYSEITTGLIAGSTKALQAEIIELGASGAHVSSLGNKFEVTTGQEFEVSFYAKASSTASVRLVFQSPGVFQGQDFELTTDWQKYTHNFVVEADAPDLQVKIWYLNAGITYSIDNVSALLEENLSVASENQLNEVVLFPIPTSNMLNIQLPQVGNYNLRVVTINGVEVLKKNIEYSNKNTVNVSTLSSGIYILEVYDGNGKKVHAAKFVKN